MDSSTPQPAAPIESPQRLVRSVTTPGSFWIWGPPGAGKTTLARSATRDATQPTVWIRLDALDRDPPMFFARAVAAVRAAQAAELPGLPACTAAHLSGIAAYSRLFSERLFDHPQRAVTLVLDGAEAIVDAPWVPGALRQLCEARSTHARILVTARVRPPAALARQRVNGALVQIGPEALRLSTAEIGAALTRIGCNADAARVAQVDALSRGWAAGVAALGATLQAGRSLEALPATATDWLVDYFVGEVLEPADAATRRVLYDVAFLPFVDATVLAHLHGTQGVLEVLGRCASEGLFVERIDEFERSPRFVVHPLFASALQARLAQQSQRQTGQQVPGHESPRDESAGTAVREAQRRAARALQAAQALEAALELFCACGDVDEAARVLAQLAASLYRGGRFEALRGWGRRLPRERLREHPSLCYWIGLAELFFDPAGGRDWLGDAIAGLQSQGERDLRLAALGYMIGSYFIEHSSTVPITPWLDQLHAHSADFAALTDAGTRANVAVAAFSGMLLAAPDHPELPRWEERLHALLAEPVDAVVRMRGALMLVKHYYYTGQYERIGPLRERLEPLASRPDLAPYAKLAWYLVRLPECWTMGDAAGAQRELSAALGKAHESGIHALDNHNRLHGVCALLLNDQLEPAARLLRQVQLSTLPAKHMEGWHLHLHRAWHALLAGDAARATAYATACLRDAHTLGGVANAMFAQVALAYAATDRDARHSAVQALRELAERARSDIGRFHSHVLDAVALIEAGAPEQAHAPIAAAAALGERHGYLHFHFAVPAVLARFCAAALQVEPARPFAQRLIRARRLQPPADVRHDPRWPRPVRVHALGRFDIFVNDALLAEQGRAQRRPIELLQALIAFGADRVPVVTLCDALWPDLDGDAARQAFKVALHRLRRLLGASGSVQIRNELASLDPAIVWVDVLALNAWLRRTDALEGGMRRQAPIPGPLFPGVEAPWAMGARRELERVLAARAARMAP